MSLYWLIKLVWPEKNRLAIAVGLCAVVYPGFQAQYSSMIFGIAFFIFSLFVLSLYFSVKNTANSNCKYFYLVISLIFSAISLLTSEYFFILELARYFLIWVYISKSDFKSKFYKFSLASLPYLALYLSTIIWRLAVEDSETTYSFVLLENLHASFLPTLINQSIAILKDLWYTSVKVWLDAIYPAHLISQQGQRIVIAHYSLIILLFTGIAYYLKNNTDFDNESDKFSSKTEIFFFGLMALIFAGVPFWLAGLPVTEKYFYTRWTLPFIIGSSIFTLHLLSLLFRKKLGFILIVSALVSLGAGTQFLAGNSFRQDWNNQNLLYWELIWRIPSLKEDTVLFSDMLNFNYENSDQLSSGINFSLSHRASESKIPYFLFFLPERINTSILPELNEDIPITGKRYYSAFRGNTSQALVIDFRPPVCLKILDPIIDQDNPGLNPIVKQALFLSRPELIDISDQNEHEPKTTAIIGAEPKREWCYYFEKADLASQFQDWESIRNLYEEVSDKKYQPRDVREWFPFIEGFSHLSKWQEAAELSSLVIQDTNDLAPSLCTLWERIASNTPEDDDKQLVVSQIFNSLNCQ